MATANVPAFIKQELNLPAEAGKGLGTETLTADDLMLPRIKLLQALSPEVDEDNDRHVEGAKPGKFLNTVSGQVYDDMLVVSVYYQRRATIFRKREMGGGKVAEFDSIEDARRYMEQEGLNPNEHDISESGRHILAILNENGEVVDQAVYDMAGTALTISNAWNTKIRLTKVDRFASVWRLSPLKRKNSKGSWYVPNVEMVGYADEALYNELKGIYMSFSEKDNTTH